MLFIIVQDRGKKRSIGSAVPSHAKPMLTAGGKKLPVEPGFFGYVRGG
jgi:hypothetical protein